MGRIRSERDPAGRPDEMMETTGKPKLYGELSWLWPVWGDPDEYADYCAHAARLMREHALVPVRTLLDIGCGGGKNAFNLKRHFEVTGLDLSPEMLGLAGSLNPECVFAEGDMRSFDLGRTFDAVLMDDAVSYMVSRDDLRAAFSAAWRHLAPGGVMVVTPDGTKETFVQNRTDATPGAGKLKPPGTDVVFVENDYDPDPEDDTYEATMIYLIRQNGRLRVETDLHVLGLFPREFWREALAEKGFRIREEPYSEHGMEYGTFACLKPL